MVVSGISPLDAPPTSSLVKQLGESLRSTIDAEALAALPTEKEKIEYALGNNAVLEAIQSCIATELAAGRNGHEKDHAKALSFKKDGNDVFGKGHYYEALHLYTKSLAHMPEEDKHDLAIVYANRSAALFYLAKYDLVHHDVDMAFSFHYPKELHYKLHERSGRSFHQQGKASEAVKHFKLALTTLNDSGQDDNKMAKTKKTLQDLLSVAVKNRSDEHQNFGQDTQVTTLSTPELSGGSNRLLRAASSKLSLRQNERDGRFVVANENIKPGDVIIVQKAFVSNLSPEFYHKQCYFCFAPTLAPLPCRHCIWVSYCSEKCRNQSWNLYHKYECRILGVLANSGVSITCYMALRLILQTGMERIGKWLEYLLEQEGKDNKGVNKTKLEEEIPSSATSPSSSSVLVGNSGSFSNEEYRADHISLFQLVTHSRRRGVEDIFHRTIMALYLLTLVKSTRFFKEGKEKGSEGREGGGGGGGDGGTAAGGLEKPGENNGRNKCGEEWTRDLDGTYRDEVAVGTILLRSLQFLQFNAHEVAAWDNEKSESVFLGGGLFLTLALFNHSCNPAIVRYFVNDTVVVRAVRTIYKGEQVTENYGPLFTANSREERRVSLESQYWFQCQCVSCREDWPTFDNLKLSDSFRFRCSFCHAFLGKSDEESSMGLLLECRRCSRPTNILKSLKDLQASEGKYMKALELLKKGQEETALGILLQNLSLFDSILLPPFKDYHLCQEAVRKCFLTLGNQTQALRIKV